MVVGNLGSKYRFAYGVVGDHVNLGSRLEGLNKAYRTDIIIGENTAQLVEGAFRLRELDMVRVIGRKQAVRIYELIALAGTSLDPGHEQTLQLYAQALEAYRKGMWAEAVELFRHAQTLRPDDGPSRVLAQRCLEYEAHPPEAWDGVFQQQFK
jgi:adenylate cyclase